MNGKFDFAKLFEQSKLFFQNLSLRQKVLLAGGTLLVAVVLLVFVQVLGGPAYKTLYSGLNADDSQAITARLAAANIPFQISRDGTSVLVASEKLDDARLRIASQPMPRSGRLGFELFDKPNWAGSDFSEKVNYQRALEGELERTVETMSEVEGVRVHLVMPAESLYSDRERAAKASVVIKLKSGQLSDQSETAIRRLVAGAVDGLTPENVVVVDAETKLPLGHPGRRLNAGGDSDVDQEYVKRVLNTLEPLVGSEGVRASVHVEYDLSSGDETKETYDPSSAVPLSTTKSEERQGNEMSGGIPGTSGNLPNAKIAKDEKLTAQNHSSQTESSTYAVNHVLKHTIQPSGRISRISAALLVDDAIEVQQQNNQRTSLRRHRSADEMKQIEELARASLSIDPSRGDVLAVENISFQNLAQDAPAPATKFQRVQTELKNWAWLLRYGALASLFGSVYLLLLRPVKNQIVSTFKALPGHVLSKKAELPRKAGDARPILQTASADEILGEGQLESDPSQNRLSAMKSRVVEKIKNEPANASRLVQGWLQEAGVE